MKTSCAIMSLPNSDDLVLLIRCPSCGQRFKVAEDLRGRTVECGGCEHRFRINDDVIVRGRKFYPGEHKDAGLNRFHRVPMALDLGNASMPSVQYADPPDPVRFEPASPLRILTGLVGVAGIVFMALFLMFGASRGGALDGMTTENRLLMAGFTGLMGVAFLFYANPRARLKALVIGLLLTAGLIILPFFFTEGSVIHERGRADGITKPAGISSGTPADSKTVEVTQLRDLIGTGPLEKEIARLDDEGSTRKAVGLWLSDLRESNRILVRDYILRVTKADPQSHFYPRDDGDFLMVVTGIEQSLDEMAAIAANVGTVERIYPEIAVVKVKVDNDRFLTGSIEKLSDKTHPAFYDLNKRELESIDLERVSKAVKRLADAEPKIYRSDITRKFIELLGEDWVDFKGELCAALAVWSEQPGPAGDAALGQARKLLASKDRVPEEMIALIVKEKNPGVVPVLDGLWRENPTRWESHYGDVGPAAESQLIKDFPDTQGTLRHSAVRLLGRVGSAMSVPVLTAAADGADAELRVLVKNSLAAIHERTGE